MADSIIDIIRRLRARGELPDNEWRKLVKEICSPSHGKLGRPCDSCKRPKKRRRNDRDSKETDDEEATQTPEKQNGDDEEATQTPDEQNGDDEEATQTPEKQNGDDEEATQTPDEQDGDDDSEATRTSEDDCPLYKAKMQPAQLPDFFIYPRCTCGRCGV